MSDTNDKKNAAILYADLKRSIWGIRSYLTDRLAGRSVLERTISRLEQADRLDEIIVFCPDEQQEQVRELLGQTTAIVKSLSEPVPVSKRMPQRKWAMNNWRGGIREATQFDEQAFTAEMVQYARERKIYTALSVAGEAVVVDPELIDALLEHHHEHGDAMRFTFTQAGPGLCGGAYRLDLLHELVLTGAYIGDLLRYDPATPHADYIVQECNYKVDPELYTTQFRYIADTRRSFRTIENLITKTGDSFQHWDAKRIISELEQQCQGPDILPREVEIEITTEPSLRIKGYPHREGSKHPNRQRMSLACFEKIIEQLAEYDDICLTIGGFGEPLSHPELMAMIDLAKAAGILGINIETDGRLLKGELAKLLSGSEVDIISVYLDADSGELYHKVKGKDCFDEVVGQLEAFIEKTNGTGPMILPHLVKTRQTMAQMEAFYDRWLKKCDGAVIVGYNDFAGQIEDKSVMDMASPHRLACRRLLDSMTILTDGCVTICGQDFMGSRTVGNVNEKSIKELWRSQLLEELRTAHRQRNFEMNELCGKCKEWHR
ncbi:MAG: SPASM domain-containing protein [Sedimentisphaerales bacterium]|nr:SPASM domain-containing protein [Sedimentisphaerales bacterium]